MASTAHVSSLEIAQRAELRPIVEIAEEAGIEPDELESYGRYKAKVDLSVLDRLADRPDAPLVCVTSITPTRSGEGKTTTAVALTQALGSLGGHPVLCLREPSLGPVFGIKGGAAGGGYSQVVPMEDINLHFTGDIHAIAAANNLLAALIDAHIMHGNALGIDPLSITWRRCLDMNDRSLRQIITGLGGRTNGSPRETGFDIAAASEVMAIVAVSSDLADLRRRLGAITIGRTGDGDRVTAEALGAAGSMAVLLKDVIKPNLVQTLEGQPVFVHAGPFANIASGNNSVIADRIALKLGDVVVTESGFGADMGFEKLCDLVSRAGNLEPAAAVVVITPKTLASHGPQNLERHLAIVRAFGLEPVVAVNRHPDDTVAAAEAARAVALEAGAYAAALCDGFERGGAGALELAEAVAELVSHPTEFHRSYDDADPIETKIAKVAALYGAVDVALSPAAKRAAKKLREDGLGELPVCIAKTHLSLTHDPKLGPGPIDFTLPVRDLVPYTGAGWILALAGDMQTMPGLGADPAAVHIDLDDDGKTVGLF
jgi:formate--tetrahydrofolate ligase